MEDMADLVPDNYAATLDDLKRQVHAARYQAQRTVNRLFVVEGVAGVRAAVVG